MRWISLAVGFLMAGLLTGCGWFHRGHAKPAALTVAPLPPPPMIVTPAETAAAYVLLMNESGRFVVLNFPSGQIPAEGKMLNVYRGGLKTGEVRISKYWQENNVTADIISGVARKGDEVRGE